MGMLTPQDLRPVIVPLCCLGAIIIDGQNVNLCSVAA